MRASWVLPGVLLDSGQAPPLIPPQTLLIILILLGAVLALRLLKRGSTRTRAAAGRGPAALQGGDALPGAAAREPGGALPPPRGQDPELARLYIELNEFSREMEGRMDTKIAYLKRLIADAEKVMVKLNGSIAAAEALKAGEGPGRAAASLPGAKTPGGAPPLPADSADGGPPSPGLSEPPSPFIDVLIGGEPPAAGSLVPEETVQERILSLFKAGKPKEAIAEEVGVPRGEVELVLSLHRASRKRAPSRAAAGEAPGSP